MNLPLLQYQGPELYATGGGSVALPLRLQTFADRISKVPVARGQEMGWSFALAGGGHRAPSCSFPTFWDAIPWRIYAATVPLDGQLQGSSEAYYPVAVEVGPWWYWLSATLAVNSLSQQNQTKMPWTLNRPWCDGYTHSLSEARSTSARGAVHLLNVY